MWVVLYNGWLQKCIIPSITWFHMTIKEDHHVAGCSISAHLLGSDQSHRLLMPVPEKNATNMRSKTRCFNQSPFFWYDHPKPTLFEGRSLQKSYWFQRASRVALEARHYHEVTGRSCWPWPATAQEDPIQAWERCHPQLRLAFRGNSIASGLKWGVFSNSRVSKLGDSSSNDWLIGCFNNSHEKIKGDAECQKSAFCTPGLFGAPG